MVNKLDVFDDEVITREMFLTAEENLLELAKEKVKKTLEIVNSLLGTMKDRVCNYGTLGEREGIYIDEMFISKEVGLPLSTALENLGKIKVPKE